MHYEFCLKLQSYFEVIKIVLQVLFSQYIFPFSAKTLTLSLLQKC